MGLVDLLICYKKLPVIKKIIDIKEEEAKDLVVISRENNNYIVEPTDLLLPIIGTKTASITLNEKFHLKSSNCHCLEFYRKKECAHTTILYALALKLLQPVKFNKIVKAYKDVILTENQQLILNQLANDLRTTSSYFKQIHLAVEINNRNGINYLALHIGFDKEYVIKNINEFVENMEKNNYFSYGQKLGFVHSYEVLDDESKEFYSFLTNIIHDDTMKSIELKRSQVLKILEIYHNSGIYFSINDEKSNYYPIVDVDNLKIVLDDKLLYIDKPAGTRELICGINYAYFVGHDRIYSYRFKKRNEAIIFSALFKSPEKSLIIEAIEKDFIANLLPVLKQEVVIEDSFYERFSLPPVVINSFFEYHKGNIKLNYKVIVDDSYSNTPYVNQIIDGYIKCLESFNFIKSDDSYILSNADEQYFFLTSDLSALKNYGEVFFDESLKRLTLKKSNRINVNISYKIGLLNFQFDSGELTLEEVQAMINAYRHKKKFVKLKNDVILKIEEDDVKELDSFLEDFNIDTNELLKPVDKPLNYILKLVGTNNYFDLDDKVVEMIDTIQNYNSLDVMPPKTFLEVLRPYQLEAFKWLKTLASFGFGGILADDMGLGKTLEIISFIASDQEEKPSLIVCPMSLVYNWENECNKWNFKTPVNLIIGGASEREDVIKTIKPNAKAIYITSYDSLRRDIAFYESHFRFIVADEAQFIKNQNALKSTAIKQLTSDMNFALTGTPIENGLADLWNIFDFLMPGYLASYNHFKDRYEALIMHDDYETLDLLKKRVQPFILRRTKKDVLKELPDKLEEIYYCKMTEEQDKLYKAYVEDIKKDLNIASGNVLAMLTRLRQICITPELIYDSEFNSAKLNLTLELIKRGLGSKHRILLFSQFSSVFPILAKMLNQEGISYYILDGSTSAHKRIELVDEFNQNSNIKVFMISLKAGGTGLNLTGADMVIHLDPWWNYSAENQATDRAYRIGQTKKVFVLKLVCKDTIEERVLKLQQLKAELADSIIQNKKVMLTKEDIMNLLD